MHRIWNEIFTAHYIKQEFSLFDPKFLEEIANMKERNLAVELLKKLIVCIEEPMLLNRKNFLKSSKG